MPHSNCVWHCRPFLFYLPALLVGCSSMQPLQPLLEEKLGLSLVTTSGACNLLSYRGTSLIRNSALLGPYSWTMHRALWLFLGGHAVSYEGGTPVCSFTIAKLTHLLALFPSVIS